MSLNGQTERIIIPVLSLAIGIGMVYNEITVTGTESLKKEVM